MHLYTYDPAPNPQRVRHLLNYKGVSLETTQLDLATGEHFAESFKQINVDCTVPTLVLDDGVVLTDTIAICVYLDKLYPEKSLFGGSDSEYAQVIGWCHKIFLEGFMAVAEVLRNKSKAFAGKPLPGRVSMPQIPELIERGALRLSEFWTFMDKHLQNNDYIVGDKISMADIDLYTVCGFSGWIKTEIPSNCEALLQWQQRVKNTLAN